MKPSDHSAAPTSDARREPRSDARRREAEVPRCQKCRKWATQQDIDGDWWPPCGCGIQHLRYEEPAHE